MPGRITKRDDSATVSDDRVSSIRLELEQLLALGDLSESNGEIGTEVLNEKRREARKVLHKQKNENSKETNDDTDIKKRPKRTKRDRGIKSCSNRSSKESVNGLQENEESNFKCNISGRGSKSPRRERKSPQRGHKDLNSSGQGAKLPIRKSSRREIRKIKYNKSSETESAEERDRDTRSSFSRSSKESRGSKGSKGARISRRHCHRKPICSKSTDDVKGIRNKYKNTVGEHDPKKTIPIQRATSRRKAMRRRSWSFDDFSNTSWSSSQGEDDIEIGLNDACEVDLNDEDVIGLNDEDVIGLNDEDATEARQPLRRPLRATRSVSMGGLTGRNQKRNSGANAIDGDMILGDPSRKGPLSRSKSNASRLRIGGGGDRRAPPTRSQSNDFAEYLSKRGLLQKSKAEALNIVESKGEEERNNPFEVTYQSQDVSEDWDPFTSNKSTDKDAKDSHERRGKLRQTKSGGLLQTSSKDTISRFPVGANFLAASASSIHSNSSDSEACDASKEEREKQRDKQRRADYKKSIAAAAMAGRKLSGTAPRTNQRHARTVPSSFEDSVKQLEFALQRAL